MGAAKIIRICYRPRIHEVQLENGTRLERNRKFIFNSHTSCDLEKNKESEKKIYEQNNAINYKIMNQKQDCKNNESQNTMSTRSDRIVKKPLYLEDYTRK